MSSQDSEDFILTFHEECLQQPNYRYGKSKTGGAKLLWGPIQMRKPVWSSLFLLCTIFILDFVTSLVLSFSRMYYFHPWFWAKLGLSYPRAGIFPKYAVNSTLGPIISRTSPDLRALANVKLNSLVFSFSGYQTGIWRVSWQIVFYKEKVMCKVKLPSLQEAFHLLLTPNYTAYNSPSTCTTVKCKGFYKNPQNLGFLPCVGYWVARMHLLPPTMYALAHRAPRPVGLLWPVGLSHFAGGDHQRTWEVCLGCMYLLLHVVSGHRLANSTWFHSHHYSFQVQ